MSKSRNHHPTPYRRSSVALAGLCLGALALLAGCSREVSCDDPEVVEKMLVLAKRGAVTDLAGQCASRLHDRIPALAAACPAGASSDDAGCAAACKTWAEGNITATAGALQTLFQDDLVATRRCRAAVRFEVAFDGGQTVDGQITYVAAPEFGGVQVALSE